MVQAEGASISISGAPPRSTMFAKAHRTHAGTHYAARSHYRSGQPQTGLAYAPARYAPSTVQSWQADPFSHW
jgi:hypothetical protein